MWYWERLEYMRWMMAVTLPKTTACIRAGSSRAERRHDFSFFKKKKNPDMFFYSPPMSITQMEKIFSASVLAHTLPKPTLVRLLRVK